jgi:hypothetical protein
MTGTNDPAHVTSDCPSASAGSPLPLTAAAGNAVFPSTGDATGTGAMRQRHLTHNGARCLAQTMRMECRGVVPGAGVEPATFGLQNRCSTN